MLRSMPDLRRVHGRSLAVAVLAATALMLWAPHRVDAEQTKSVSELRRQATGSFRFVDPGSSLPITVWFCRPPAITADSRIVFVMHGSDSQTARQACDLASPLLQELDAIVLAPQFAEEYYPGDAYMLGSMVDAAGKALPKSKWALTAIERLFDLVRHEMELSRPEYDIVGFSGGGQFVHRLVLFVPEARFRRAVAASAARYAFPSSSARFPYGLADSPTDRKDLLQAFSRDFVLLLGDQDVADISARDAGSIAFPVNSGLRSAQGTTRFARGLRFFATAVDEAADLGVPLLWKLRIVPGVGHSPMPIVRAALESLR